jgi:hypothetical protein
MKQQYRKSLTVSFEWFQKKCRNNSNNTVSRPLASQKVGNGPRGMKQFGPADMKRKATNARH